MGRCLHHEFSILWKLLNVSYFIYALHLENMRYQISWILLFWRSDHDKLGTSVKAVAVYLITSLVKVCFFISFFPFYPFFFFPIALPTQADISLTMSSFSMPILLQLVCLATFLNIWKLQIWSISGISFGHVFHCVVAPYFIS